MVSNSRITTTLPAVELNRAKKFYHETLGLKIVWEDEQQAMFEGGNGTTLYIYKRAPSKADHTVASFEVKDIESEVRELRRKGIKLEEYDMPEMGLKTVNGIASFSSDEYETKSAWFKDTEDNILALVQMTKVGSPARRERESVGARR